MNKDTINDISELISSKMEQIYNTAIYMANIRLLNNYKDNVKEWQKKQRTDLPLLKRDINQLVKREIRPLFNTIEEALILAYAYSRTTSESITKEEIQKYRATIRENKQERFNNQLEKLKRQSVSALNQLPNAIVNIQRQNINEVGYSIRKEASVDELYNGIVKQTATGVENAPKIVYSDGKRMPFTSYVDMKARTTLQEFTNKNQLDGARANDLVFWLVSSFGDSAKDHVNFQGRIYIDKNWESIITDEETKNKIRDYIASNNTLTKQDVEDNDPYLTTRPNCRHTWLAMSTDEVIGGKSVDKMLKENNMLKNGNYEEEKAKARNDLRYEERLIRKYKLRKEQLEKQKEESPKDISSNVDKELRKTNALIRRHQSSAKSVVNQNGFLERDYARENPRIIRTDLGVRYNQKYYKN